MTNTITGDAKFDARIRKGEEAAKRDRIERAAPALLEMIHQAVALMPLGTSKRAKWVSEASALIVRCEGGEGWRNR